MPAQEKIRVLIVDDIQETRENIRRMLQFESSVEVIGAAKNGQEAIEIAVQEKPDVIIMDINMPDMDGITATERIRKKVPFAQIIILSVQSDPNYMRRAMLAGARDFLSKPPMIDELTSAVKRAGEMAADERSKSSPGYPSLAAETRQSGGVALFQRGKILTVYSPKGGVGCTTLAINLAVALKKPDNRVVIVDGNLQFGDIAILLNEQGKNSLYDLTKRVDELDPDVVEEVVTTHKISDIDILACPNRIEIAATITGEEFGKMLQFLRQIYHYIVVDTSSYLTDAVQAALDESDYILLVTTQDIPSIKSCSLFLTIATEGNLRDRILFVMNRFDRRLKLTPEKVGETLHQTMIGAIPLDDKVIPFSVNRGIPFVLENRTHPVSKSVINLAEQIQSRIQQDESSPEKEGSGRK
ncbi:MAG: response regulator [Chloroflexota bacterium]|jgi:pilus assembly protein CpaE